MGVVEEESPDALVALKAAKAKLNVPISVQIGSTTQYLERVRKRLVQAEAYFARVAAQKDHCVADVEAAERRLERYAILIRDSLCSPGEKRALVFLLLVLLMVRKGWTKIEVPEGWQQIIRGPRPSSVQWPRAVRHPQKQGTRNPVKDSVPAVKSKVVKDTKVARLKTAISALGDQESTAKAPRMEAKVVRHPQERAEEAADRISRLQYALDLLGHDSPEAEFLKVSVQEESCVRPVGERLDSYLQHRTCERMRVSRRGQDLRRPGRQVVG